METSQFLRANALAKDDDLQFGGLLHLADEVPENGELRLHDRLGAAAQAQVNRGLHPRRETQDQKEASEHVLQDNWGVAHAWLLHGDPFQLLRPSSRRVDQETL